MERAESKEQERGRVGGLGEPAQAYPPGWWVYILISSLKL
jgi:hypothetical protein